MSKWLVVLSLVFGVSTTAHANLILNGIVTNTNELATALPLR